jgi:CDP-4-dehydro-6-deoxyglucose reductase
VSYRVRLEPSGQTFDVVMGETLLAAALRAHIALAHDCQLGGCGTCRIQLREGCVSYPEFPLALTPEEESEGYALACQARPASNLVISAPARDDLPQAQRHRAVVRVVRPLGPDVVHLVLDIPGDTAVRYQPGQHMNVIMPDGGTRSFSMASRPNGSQVDFHVRRVAGGRFTGRQLAGLKAGDELEVELPLGNFQYHRRDERPLLMVATGTGLAPIKAMLEALMDDPDCPPVSLYWGARTAADLYLDAAIRAWGARLFEFRYVPVLSRPTLGWAGRCGYVQDAVTVDFGELSEYAIYLCGSPAMIADAKQAFFARGAAVTQTYSEGFTFQAAGPGGPAMDTRQETQGG